MAEIIKLGCLQFNRQPVAPGAKHNGENISFGDTIQELAIPFVKWKNLLLATQCVCTNISWEDLNLPGFIFGYPIKIDGTPYTCRSFQVGKTESASSEWDNALDDLGEDDSLWHWDKMYFWGQDTAMGWNSRRVRRGYHSARTWNCSESYFHGAGIGFRPVLEPLPLGPLVSESLVGVNLEIYSSGYMFDGELVDFNDYDMVILPSGPYSISDDCKCASIAGDNIIIDREAIAWMKKID